MEPRELVKKIGPKTLRSALGVGHSAVGHIGRRGPIPASWYVVVCELCREQGLPAPDKGLFNFRMPKSMQDRAGG